MPRRLCCGDLFHPCVLFLAASLRPANPVVLVRTAHSKWRLHLGRIMEIKGWILPLSDNGSWSDHSAQDLLKIHRLSRQWEIVMTPADVLLSGKVLLTCNSQSHTFPNHAALTLLCVPEAWMFSSTSASLGFLLNNFPSSASCLQRWRISSLPGCFC